MQSILKSLLIVLSEATHEELARQIQYLKAENEILRSKLPRRVLVIPAERRKLVKFAQPVGRAIWQLATVVVPETILRWIREDRRSARRGRLPAPSGRRRTRESIRRLIIRLGRETGWGYTRIMGELKKLGIKPPSRNTVKKILKERGLDPESPRGAGTWDEFLKRHAHSLWQCDFVRRRVISWRGIREAYLLVFLHVASRRVIVSPPTYHPDGVWVTEQTDRFVEQARSTGLAVAHLFHDGDGKFRTPYQRLWRRHRIRNRTAPFRAPNTQAYVERFIQTLQQECWDHFVVCGLRHLAFLTWEFLEYYHAERPHQGVGNELLMRAPGKKKPVTDSMTFSLRDVRCRKRLGGLLKHYERRAA